MKDPEDKKRELLEFKKLKLNTELKDGDIKLMDGTIPD